MHHEGTRTTIGSPGTCKQGVGLGVCEMTDSSPTMGREPPIAPTCENVSPLYEEFRALFLSQKSVLTPHGLGNQRGEHAQVRTA
jgi:hypothetical protein